MLRLAGNGLRIAKAVPLIMGDTVEKADIEICKSPSGEGDWLLGSGASGRVSFASCLSSFHREVYRSIQTALFAASLLVQVAPK